MHGLLPTKLNELETLSDEIRRHLAKVVVKLLAFINDHKKFWLLPIIVVGLLLGTWAVFTEPVVAPYAHLGQK